MLYIVDDDIIEYSISYCYLSMLQYNMLFSSFTFILYYYIVY